MFILRPCRDPRSFVFVASDVSIIHSIQNQSAKDIFVIQRFFLCKNSAIPIVMIVSLVKCDVGCVLWISDLLIEWGLWTCWARPRWSWLSWSWYTDWWLTGGWKETILVSPVLTLADRVTTNTVVSHVGYVELSQSQHFLDANILLVLSQSHWPRFNGKVMNDKLSSHSDTLHEFSICPTSSLSSGFWFFT